VDKRKISKEFAAVILCAGTGSRIKNFTKKPKTLLKIGSKTIIERIILSLKKNNINNINIVTGYKSALLKKEIIKLLSAKLKVRFIKNKNPKKFGNTYSLYLGVKNLNQNTIIIDGDLVYEEKLIGSLQKQKKDLLVVGQGKISDIECAKTLVDKKGLVKKTIDKRALYDYEKKKYKFIGEAIGLIRISKESMYKFKSFCKYFLNKDTYKLNWEHFINYYTIKNKFYPYKIANNFKWIEIDTYSDYKKAKKIFNR